MKQSILARALAAGSILAPWHAAQAAPDYASLVNPLIGTANGGNVFPGVATPFGMVQFSPEESPDPKKSRPIAAPGGYQYHLDRIRGFSLTNVSGWGCAGGSGDIPLTPITTAVTGSPSADFRHDYSSPFSHANEKAEAGAYRVKLDNGVTASLTATTRTGSARFSYPAGAAANLLVRVSDSEVGSEAAKVHVDPAHRVVSGEVTSGNFCGYINKEDRRSYYTLHFVAVFDQPFKTYGVWKDTWVMAGATDASGGTTYGETGFPPTGKGSGGWVGFDSSKSASVNVRIGISYVSEANAWKNLNAENPEGTTFEAVREQARTAWNKRLGQIATAGGTSDQRTVFYTALYHSLLHPNVFSDVNGQYAGFDGQAHALKGKQQAQYANFSGWDVYRDQLQLVTWLDPKVGGDIAQSLFNQARQNGGVWDRWTHESGGVHVMNGDPAAPALADIWAFGGHDFEANAAFNSIAQAADHPTIMDLSHDGCEVECAGQRPGLDQWLTHHFIPVGAPAWGGGADTLEDATAEFGLSAFAERLGQHDLAGRFLGRAQYWRNLFNPKAAPDGGYIQNRNTDGTWALVKDDDDKAPRPFTPDTGDGFVEGTAAQYVWMVPFNIAGLFDAMGGLDKARVRLDRFFYTPEGKMAVTNAGPLHPELNNEPSIGTPWLYDYAGEPWKTQELVRQVMNTIWLNAPEGIPGNDDLGAMSSWYVWAALGLYPEIPGRAELVLGSPFFPEITVHRPLGDVTIHAKGAAADRPYIHALKVDGQTLERPWLPEDFTLRGGTLDYELDAAPAKSWGGDPKAAPPSFDVPAL